MATILKIIYWLGNATILYLYFTSKLETLPWMYLIWGSIIWIIISLLYAHGLSKYLFSRGKKGMMM